MQGFLKIRGCSKCCIQNPIKRHTILMVLEKDANLRFQKLYITLVGTHLKVHFFFSQIERLKTYKGTLKLLPNPLYAVYIHILLICLSVCLSVCVSETFLCQRTALA